MESSALVSVTNKMVYMLVMVLNYNMITVHWVRILFENLTAQRFILKMLLISVRPTNEYLYRNIYHDDIVIIDKECTYSGAE